MMDDVGLLPGQTSPQPTRRVFLQGVAAVGGTAMMLAAMDAWGIGIASAKDRPPLLDRNASRTKVTIIGAGLAGMAAAYELGKFGYDCQIIEARSFAGGRCQTARAGFELSELGGVPQRCRFDPGLYFNHGPWRIPIRRAQLGRFDWQHQLSEHWLVGGKRDRTRFIQFQPTCNPVECVGPCRPDRVRPNPRRESSSTLSY